VVHYVPTVSRPADPRNAAWRGAVGRVNTVAMRLLERLQPAPADTLVYLCGHPGMIAELAAWCAERGLRSKQERFWKESIVDSGFVETPRPKR